MIDVTMV